jgi:hypothetical protein
VHVLVIAFVVLAALAGQAAAAERPLKGPEIEALLNNVTAIGQNDKGEWRQYFEASGFTVYAAGKEPNSAGQWVVRGDQYCSQWPPNDRWSCYVVTGDLDATPKTVTWQSGGGGTAYPARIEPGKLTP